MDPHLARSTERSWKVSLFGYVEATQVSGHLSALDVDDAERQALRNEICGRWTFAGDDRQVMRVEVDGIVRDRYVTHCTQHGVRQWICGLSARILVGREVRVAAASAEEAKALAVGLPLEGTWNAGGMLDQADKRIEILDPSFLSGLHTRAIIAET